MSIFSLIIMILSQFINVLHVKQKSLPSKEDFYFLYYFSKSNSWKTSLTGKLFSILSIVLASNDATETTFNLSKCFSLGKIIVSVTTTSLVFK